MNAKTQSIRENIIKKLVDESPVKPLCLLNVGSLVRGNSDKLSDFDFVVVWNNISDNIWPEGACRINDQKCGLRNTTLESLKNRDWSQIERHSYSYAKIEYDPNNILPLLIKEKCIWGKDEKLNLFCECLFHLSYIVNVTNNYKKCWNERDELEMSILRGQKLNALYLTTEFIHSVIQLALITDGAFIPSHKVCFSEWVKNISPSAHLIYMATISNLEIIQNPNIEQLKTFYKPYVKKLIDRFEKQICLPEDIMEYRNNIARISKI